ncbi:putative outer membrane protein pmp15 [Chlamydia abortus]|nr:putative outer membrane protein pmp15 [Chlamydia abortus]
MCPYRRSLFYLISFSLCSYELICLAKDKTVPSSYTVCESGYRYPLSPFFGIDRSIYTPPANHGLLHDNQMDIDITGQKYFYINYQYFSTDGGAVTAKDLSISKNTGPVIFRGNTCHNNGGAVASTNCNITENKQRCCFINNATIILPESTSSSQTGGAIQCTQLTISNNQGPCEFLSNVGALRGGAIFSNDVQITNNHKSIILNNNRCLVNTSRGGGIYSTRTCSITSNRAPITFINNQSGFGGGIFSEDCDISYNSEIIVFLNNSSLSHVFNSGENFGGGAIYSNTCNITNNPKGVIFQNNVSRRNGGAIHANSLTIQDNGPILFLKNVSPWGAGIQSYSVTGRYPKFYLSADHGNIVFKGNVSITSNKRNAIHSTSGLNLQIGARQGYSVKFYDPIEHEHITSSPLVFNPEDYHLGTVLFSGADVSPNEANESNYHSLLRNTYNIAHGVVAVEDKADLGIYKISQEEGILRLGNGAVIRTLKKYVASSSPTSVDSRLDLTKLALNLPSILTQGANAPKIWIYPDSSTRNGKTTYSEDNNPTIILSGPLLLLDNDNQDPYDSLDLSSGITRAPLLYLCDNNTKKIDTTQLDIQAMNKTQHYGYQGIWSPYWEEYTTEANNTSPETANTSHRYLYTDWTPTGYIPNPLYRGDLVANALWQSAYNVTTGLHTLEHFSHKVPNREISGGGLGAYVLQKTRNSQQGFQLFSKGYSTKVAGSTETQHNFALSFAQFYSEIRESKFKNKVSSNCYFAGAQVQLPLFDADILTSTSLGYVYSHSRVKTNNPTLKTTSEGHFHGHTIGSEICCMLPEGGVSYLQFRPFIKALGIHAIQESFKETGDHIRSFETQYPLINVTLPIGISCHAQHEANLKTDWEFQVAYTPTIYRHKPRILTTRWISKGSWITSGTPVDYHAGSIAINNTTSFFNKMSLSINYRGDFSKSTLCNFLNITSELQF